MTEDNGLNKGLLYLKIPQYHKKTVKNYENIMVPIFRIFVVNQQFVESSVHLTSTHLFMQGNWIVNAVEKSWGHAFH